MKTTTKVAFSAALILGALTSCDKENGFFGRIGSSTIGISSVKAEAPATKAVTEETSQVTLEDGSVFTIHKTVEPYTTAPQTKAGIKATDNINEFTLYGYLDAEEIAKAESASEEDKTNNNFIPEANVIKGDDGKFHTEGNYFWRQNITHYFWAQSGATGMTTTANSASFTKAANSDEDILVAYASKKWYEHSGDDHSSDNLDINFKHALSAAKVKRGTVEYKQKDASGNITPAQEGRVELHHINLLRMKEGSCAVDKDMNFTWTGLAKNGVTEIQEETETILSIPQNTAAFEVYYTDTYRTVTRPVVIQLNTDKDDWQAGNLYSYTLNGTVTVPKLNEKPNTPGINPNFKGNEKRSEPLTTSLDVTYYKSLEISWDNLPTTNGNKTYAIVYYGEDKIDVSDMTKVKSNTNVLFVYNVFDKTVEKIVNGEIKKIAEKDHCSIILNTESLTGSTNIYVAYNGGSNGGNTKWILENLNFKVIEYK